MEIHQISSWIENGKTMWVGYIKQNLGKKQAFFHSTSRRVLLAYMFQAI